MRSKSVFAEVETLSHRMDVREVSPLALEIHVRAVGRSVRTANPAFIADATLDGLAPGNVTTMAAIELCLAGLWHRTGNGYGGYVIADGDLIDHMAQMRFLRRAKAACRGLWRELTSERFIPL